MGASFFSLSLLQPFVVSVGTMLSASYTLTKDTLMAIKAQTLTQTPIKRQRPVRDAIGSVADGIGRVVPEVVDLAVESTKSVRLIATTVRLSMAETVMDQIVDTLGTFQALQKEQRYSDEKMSLLAELSGMEDVAKLLRIK